MSRFLDEEANGSRADTSQQDQEMSEEGLQDESTSVFPIQGGACSEASTERVSEALVLQARQMVKLASMLRADPSTDADKYSELLCSDTSSPGIFFRDDRDFEPDTRDLARIAYRLRRMRETIFNEPDLFSEPAWDILLDLSIAHESGVRVSVSSACVGACVPSTTGLRWLSILESKGLVEREDDLLDGRRTYVRLSRKGLSKMEEYLRASRGI